ncbi:MAG: alkaline shock response membrane anchor protein AmaP [Verrucomicrobiota bacterium]
MKVVHFLLGLVLLVLVAGLAVFVIHAGLSPDLWSQSMAKLASSRFLAMEAAGVFLIVLALYLLTGIPRRVQAHFISFEGEGGSVSISVKAIRDFLIRVGSEFAAILNIEPVIRAPGGTIEVDLDVKVKAGTQIPELCKLLQERVRESVRDSLGLPEVKRIRINVREIVATPQEKKHEEATEWEGSVRP